MKRCLKDKKPPESTRYGNVQCNTEEKNAKLQQIHPINIKSTVDNKTAGSESILD